MIASISGRARGCRARPQALGFGALVLSVVLAACTSQGGGSPADPDAEQGPQRREVLLDQGTADVVDLRPVTVQARPGDVVVLRSANPGHGADDESPVHHLFTSAPPSSPPPLFVRAGHGHVPNPGAWGMCRGGDPADATTGCPIPAIEGPSTYDGRSYFSLGALLPGETRDLPLAPDIPPGTYRFTCAIHPETYVDVEVLADPARARPLPPLDASVVLRELTGDSSSPEGGVVVELGPHPAGIPSEILAAAPRSVRIPVGGTVTWRVRGRSPHTVELGMDHPPHLADTTAVETAPSVPRGRRWDGTGVVRSGVLSTDPSVDRTAFSLIFTRPGSYRAYDRFHTGITTVVHVG